MGEAHRQPPSASTVCWAASSHDQIQQIQLMQARHSVMERRGPERSACTTCIPLSRRCTAVSGHARISPADAAWLSNTSGATLEWTSGQFAARHWPTRSEHHRRRRRAASRQHEPRSTARRPRTQSGPAPSTDARSARPTPSYCNMASARCAKRAQVAAAARASNHALQPSTPGNRWVPPRGSGRRRRPQGRSVLCALHPKWLPLWNLAFVLAQAVI